MLAAFSFPRSSLSMMENREACSALSRTTESAPPSLCRKTSGDIMTDDRNNRGPADRKRINVGEDYERQYWTKALGVSELDLREAVKAAGPSAEKVRAFLESKRQA
jgi:hypothetical protein